MEKVYFLEFFSIYLVSGVQRFISGFFIFEVKHKAIVVTLAGLEMSYNIKTLHTF